MLIFALALLFFVSVAVIIGYLSSRQGYIAIPPTAEYVPNELIVSYREGKAPHQISEEKRLELEQRLSLLGVISQERAYLEVASGELTRSYTLKLNENVDLVQLQEQLAEVKEIASSQPNFIYHTFLTPNDPQYSSLWGMQNINAPQAWDTSTGSNSIVVAVIDTGMDISHPDLTGISVNPYSAITGSSNVSDGVGHGTHVAGTVGAIGNNSVGVVGVNWNVSIMPVQVCSPGGCALTAIVNGIYRAADNGAKVINMSLGTRAPGIDTCSSAQDTYKAIAYAISKGVTVVVAAGNDSRDASLSSPASCPGVITVGASTQSDGSSSFTNFGSVVDIAAPGVGILSTFPSGAYLSPNCNDASFGTNSDGYGFCDGTSMAAPYVAGAAALLLSVNPNLAPAQVESCLVNNADSISSTRQIGPRLNIAKALENCAGTPGTQLPTATPTPAIGATSTPTTSRFYISGRVFQDNNKDGTYNSGDLALINETLNLTGSFSDSTSTLTDGTYIFDNLFEGTFIVSYNGFSTSSITLVQSQPVITGVDFIVTKDPVNPTPTIVIGPSTIPQTPTPTQAPPAGGGATRAPTPTPPTLYNCEYDPNCGESKSNIQLCPLICTEQSGGRGGVQPTSSPTPISVSTATPGGKSITSTPTPTPGGNGNMPTATPTPTTTVGNSVRQVVDSVNATNIENNLLSIIDDDEIAGQDQLQTRYTGLSGNITESNYIQGKLTEYGLSVSLQNFTVGGVSTRNIIGRVNGTNTNDVYLVTAHMDSTAKTNSGTTDPAPGANDNGSGTVAVMETARVLKSIQSSLKTSLEFVLFSGEEQGLYGSYYYAQNISSGKNIKGVINLDMVGNKSGTSCVNFYYKNYNGGDILSNKAIEMIKSYNIDLGGASLASSNGQSDHKPFWDIGIPAIFVHECNNNWNVYHSINDKMEFINISQITNATKAVTAAVADLVIQ